MQASKQQEGTRVMRTEVYIYLLFVSLLLLFILLPLLNLILFTLVKSTLSYRVLKYVKLTHITPTKLQTMPLRSWTFFLYFILFLKRFASLKVYTRYMRVKSTIEIGNKVYPLIPGIKIWNFNILLRHNFGQCHFVLELSLYTLFSFSKDLHLSQYIPGICG